MLALLKCDLLFKADKSQTLSEGIVFLVWFLFFLNPRKIRLVLLLHPVPPTAWNQLKKVGSPRIPMIPILVTLIFMTTAVTAGTGQCILKLVLLQNMDFSPGLLSVQSKR